MSYFRLYNKLRERTKITYFMIAALIDKKNNRNTVTHVKIILLLSYNVLNLFTI